MTVSEGALYSIAALVLLVALRRLYLQAVIPQIAPREVDELLSRPAMVVFVDVRTGDERARGHIKGSIHVPSKELLRKLDVLEKHRAKQIVLYCQTGSRSMAAAATLRKHGFRVANLKGGIAEWNFHKQM